MDRHVELASRLRDDQVKELEMKIADLEKENRLLHTTNEMLKELNRKRAIRFQKQKRNGA